MQRILLTFTLASWACSPPRARRRPSKPAVSFTNHVIPIPDAADAAANTFRGVPRRPWRARAA